MSNRTADEAAVMFREAERLFGTAWRALRHLGPIASQSDAGLTAKAAIERAAENDWLRESLNTQPPAKKGQKVSVSSKEPRLRRGLAVEAVAEVLKNGHAQTEPEIESAITATYGIIMKKTTVAMALRRGADKGLYTYNKGRWSVNP